MPEVKILDPKAVTIDGIDHVAIYGTVDGAGERILVATADLDALVDDDTRKKFVAGELLKAAGVTFDAAAAEHLKSVVTYDDTGKVSKIDALPAEVAKGTEAPVEPIKPTEPTEPIKPSK